MGLNFVLLERVVILSLAVNSSRIRKELKIFQDADFVVNVFGSTAVILYEMSLEYFCLSMLNCCQKKIVTVVGPRCGHLCISGTGALGWSGN